MEGEESKQPSRTTPFSKPQQVQEDLALAITLQEQENAFARLATIESTSEEDESDDFDDGELEDENEYFESQEVQADLEFLEEEYSGTDEEMDEDDLDVDELSYEELIALGEFIGEEKRGLSITDIPRCLRVCKYQAVESKTGIDRCVICQVEYEEGEALVALACDHPFHSECISKWLQIKKICPICSTEVSPPKVASTS